MLSTSAYSPCPNPKNLLEGGNFCRIQILMKMAPYNQKNSRNWMVAFLEFGFLFPMSYRQYKIWQELKFEITFDFTKKINFLVIFWYKFLKFNKKVDFFREIKCNFKFKFLSNFKLSITHWKQKTKF